VDTPSSKSAENPDRPARASASTREERIGSPTQEDRQRRDQDRVALSNARAAAAEARRKRLEAGEKACRDPIEKARENPSSLRLAINGKCWDCQGGDADPAPRWRIGNCTIPDCPLYPVRPYRHLEGRPLPKVMAG